MGWITPPDDTYANPGQADPILLVLCIYSRCVVCAVSAPLILRIPGLGGLCHLSVEADGEAIWQAVWKVLLVSARLLSLGAETGGGQTR